MGVQRYYMLITPSSSGKFYCLDSCVSTCPCLYSKLRHHLEQEKNQASQNFWLFFFVIAKYHNAQGAIVSFTASYSGKL